MSLAHNLAAIWFRLTLVFGLCLAMPASAEELSALARLDIGGSVLAESADGGLNLTFDVSQPVPWRVRFLSAPPRLILDTREVDWTGVQRLAVPAPVLALRAGGFRAGWSRLVIELSGPQALISAEMTTATAVYCRCSRIRAPMPERPPQWSAVKM